MRTQDTKVVPWNQFNEDDVLDLLDDYLVSVAEEAFVHIAKACAQENHMPESVMTTPPIKIEKESNTTSVTSNYAKKSLKVFEDLKFPQIV